MNILVLHGSPRKGGNSDTLIESFLRGVSEGERADTKHFYPNDLSIRPCQGCLTCKTSLDHRCAIEDDMQDIYSAYIDADIIVWATPMYWGYLTAQLKTVLDRMEALAWKHFRDKTFVVMLTYRHHCESAVAFFKRIAPHFNITLNVLTCRTYDEATGSDLPISSLTDSLREAYELGKTLDPGAVDL